MSAFIVSRTHIAYMVECALRLSRNGGLSWYWGDPIRHRTLRCADYKMATELGAMLADENAKSIAARYGPDEPAEMGAFTYEKHRDPRIPFNVVALLKACDCYEYQACEHEEWKASEACAFVGSLRGYAWRSLPGYEDAPWCLEDSDSRAIGTAKARGEGR
jgi:hypothetical protein